MNILFLLKTLEVGGVEVVTINLANYFSQQGHNVSLFVFSPQKNTLISRLDSNIRVYYSNKYKCNKRSISVMRKALVDNQIHIVINQWGLPYIPIRVVAMASVGLPIKIVSVYHSVPDMNGRLLKIDNKLRKNNNFAKQFVLKLIRTFFKFVTSQSMRYNYNHSDCYMVLSSSFVEKFKQFTGIINPTKLVIQTNPISIIDKKSDKVLTKKIKEIIYVGRIDNLVKKVSRILEIWKLLENRCFNWKLTIIGDGPDRKALEKQAKSLKLINFSIEGFQDPIEYYKRASILILVSDFEGFPLVLPEAMSLGVVPIVYGSYSAVYDIIENGKNGMIIPYSTVEFPKKLMADCLCDLMSNDNIRARMAENAIEKSKEYTIETIYNEWMQKLDILIAK